MDNRTLYLVDAENRNHGIELSDDEISQAVFAAAAAFGTTRAALVMMASDAEQGGLKLAA